MIPWDFHEERGVSLIAAIVLLLVVAFMGTMAVSLMSTETMSSMGEAQSAQALYIAEGGSEFAQRVLAQNLDWYRSTTDPMVTAATALGAGTFTVTTYLPATMLSRRVTAASPTIPVLTTARFPSSGYLQLDDDMTAGGEFVLYAGVTATSFTGLTRDQNIGGVVGAVGIFPRATNVYPVTILRTALNPLAAGCGPTQSATIDIDTHPKFLPMGTITIDQEEITYSRATPNPATGRTTLSGVVRCVNATTISAPHGSGYPVTPLLVDAVVPDTEASLASTGIVNAVPSGTAVRVVQKTVQR